MTFLKSQNLCCNMEHAIGTLITLPDGRKAEVVEVDFTCIGCILYSDKCMNYKLNGIIGECSPKRSDHKHIIYKEIKEE